jgi:hypothetical protein
MLRSARRFLVVAAATVLVAGVLATTSYAGPFVRVAPGASFYNSYYAPSYYAPAYSYYAPAYYAPAYTYAPAYSYSYVPSYRTSYYAPGAAYVNYDPFYAVPSYYSYPPSYSYGYSSASSLPYYRPGAYSYSAFYPYRGYGARYYYRP